MISKSLAAGGAWRGAPQSAVTVPAAVLRPPRMWVRKSGSENEACVWPIAVYQARPPSKSVHQATGWSSSAVLPSSSS